VRIDQLEAGRIRGKLALGVVEIASGDEYEAVADPLRLTDGARVALRGSGRLQPAIQACEERPSGGWLVLEDSQRPQIDLRD